MSTIKQYVYGRTGAIFMMVLVVLICWIAIINFYEGKILNFLFFITGVALGIWQSRILFFLKARLDNDGIALISKSQAPLRVLSWNDIDQIVEDSPFPKWTCTHLYHLLPRRMPYKNLKKRLTLSTHFKNYHELLRNIVLRVSPETKVDASILQLVGLTPQDIGKLY